MERYGENSALPAADMARTAVHGWRNFQFLKKKKKKSLKNS